MTTGNNSEHQLSGVSRRTIVKGAAWSLPVIVAASAVPLAAASGCGATQVPNGTVLTVNQVGPLETKDNTGNGSGLPGYAINSLRTLSFTATFTNAGTTTVPAGAATIQLEAPYWAVDVGGKSGYMWETATVTAVSNGFTLTPKPTSQWVVSSDGSKWNGFNYTIDQAMAPGATVKVSWTVTAYQNSPSTKLLFMGLANNYYLQTYTLAKISAVQCNGVALEHEDPGTTFVATPGTH